MNPFAERYKSIKNADLLKIIANPEDYQPLAVEAAQNELANRQLSADELNEAKSELEFHQNERVIKIVKQREFENKIKTIGTSLVETFHPVQKSTFNAERSIRLINIVFAGISIYQLYKNIHGARYYYGSTLLEWLSVSFYFIPSIFLPIAVFQFWKRKRIGWILLSIYVAFSAVVMFGLMIIDMRRQFSGTAEFIGGFQMLDPIGYMMAFVFYTAALWLICKVKIRVFYGVHKKEMFETIGITVGIIAFIAIVRFFYW